MKYTFSKELYSKNALLRAAYRFTNDYYVHLTADNECYIVEMTSKESAADNKLSKDDFTNEILAQTVRENVFKETKELRTLIMARAFASSVIDNSCDKEAEYSTEEDENILRDWFEQNE